MHQLVCLKDPTLFTYCCQLLLTCIYCFYHRSILYLFLTIDYQCCSNNALLLNKTLSNKQVPWVRYSDYSILILNTWWSDALFGVSFPLNIIGEKGTIRESEQNSTSTSRNSYMTNSSHTSNHSSQPYSQITRQIQLNINL